MRKKTNICSICGAKLQKKNITYTQTIEGKIYIVTDVPAQVCSQCTEQYLTPHIVDVLQRTIEKKQAAKMKWIPVYQFPHQL